MQLTLAPIRLADILEHALHDPHHVERTRYDATLERLDRVFDAEYVLILFHETFFGEKDIRPITNFLRIHPHPASFAEVAQSKSLPLSPMHARLAREAFAPVYEYCERRFGKAVPSAWRKHIAGLIEGGVSSLLTVMSGLHDRLVMQIF